MEPDNTHKLSNKHDITWQMTFLRIRILYFDHHSRIGIKVDIV